MMKRISIIILSTVPLLQIAVYAQNFKFCCINHFTIDFLDQINSIINNVTICYIGQYMILF